MALAFPFMSIAAGIYEGGDTVVFWLIIVFPLFAIPFTLILKE
jgi:hypothetical protein